MPRFYNFKKIYEGFDFNQVVDDNQDSNPIDEMADEVRRLAIRKPESWMSILHINSCFDADDLFDDIIEPYMAEVFTEYFREHTLIDLIKEYCHVRFQLMPDAFDYSQDCDQNEIWYDAKPGRLDEACSRSDISEAVRCFMSLQELMRWPVMSFKYEISENGEEINIIQADLSGVLSEKASYIKEPLIVKNKNGEMEKIPGLMDDLWEILGDEAEEIERNYVWDAGGPEDYVDDLDD